MGMDGLRRHIASDIDGFEYLRCPFRKGTQPRVWKSVGRVDEVQWMIVRLPLRQQFDQRSAIEMGPREKSEALANSQSRQQRVQMRGTLVDGNAARGREILASLFAVLKAQWKSLAR